jgi:3-hydroxyisobutyrate dehydrogenase
MKIAFVGLGAMGLPMATALVEAHYSVTAFDMNPNRLEHFQALGGLTQTSVQEAARAANVLILMVVNAQQVDSVLFEQDALSVLAKNAVVVVSSTVAPDYAKALGASLRAREFQFIDAPVSGGVKGAKDKKLSIMASGPNESYQQVEAILKTMGANVFHLGEQNGQGSVMKVVNQLLAGVHLATAAEAVNFASSYGLDIQKVQEVIASSAGYSWMFQDRVPRMIQTNPEVKSAVDIFVKDLGIVIDLAQTAKASVPLSSAALQLFMMAAIKGHGKEDDSQVIKVLNKD